MKKVLVLLAVLGMMSVVVLGCMPLHSPVVGLVLTDVKGPIAVTSSTPGRKTGEATATTILGLVANGDASIETAAKNGGITQIMTVDHRSYSILGIYATFTTIVTGE